MRAAPPPPLPSPGWRPTHGVRADDRELAARREREHAALVLEQHDRLQRGLVRELPVLLRVDVVDAEREVRLRGLVVEEAEPHLDGREPRERRVDGLLGERAAADGRDDVVAVHAAAVDVGPGGDGRGRRVHAVEVAVPVRLGQALVADRAAVGRDVALEPPALAQRRLQQPVVRARGHAVERVVPCERRARGFSLRPPRRRKRGRGRGRRTST